MCMHKLTFFPLGNADCCLIDLDSGQKILFDYAAKRDENDDSDLRIDLPTKLREDLEEAKRDNYDVVAFTHIDDDHIHGFSEFFYLDHSSTYQSRDRVKIQTLWVPAAVILETGLEGEDKLLRAEARYRLKEGEGIRVFSKPELLKDWLKEQGLKLEDREHLITHAGQNVPEYNLLQEGVEFFIHSPFSETVDNGIVRNDSALVAQITLHVNNQLTKFILGADLDHSKWDDIVRITSYYNREERLQWDIFKISHHCSYKALSDDKGEEKTTPVSRVEWLFEQGNEGGILVSSSKEIPTANTTQPPHRQAANYYREIADNIDGEFIVTMEHPKESAPESLVIVIDASGATFKKISIGAVEIISSRPAPRAG